MQYMYYQDHGEQKKPWAVSGVCGKTRERRKVGRRILKIEDAPTEDDGPHLRSSTTDVKSIHLQSHQPSTTNMVVYYSLPAIGKVGSHYVRQALGRQTLSARSRGGFGMGARRGTSHGDGIQEADGI